MKPLAALAFAVLALAGCSARYVPMSQQPAFISGQSPPSPNAAHADPEPANSLPPGFEGQGPRGPNSRGGNISDIQIRTPF